MATEPILLLVDPEERSRRVLEVSLGRAGFTVETVEGMEDALVFCSEQAPDLLITATQLADGDGYACATAVKAEASTANTPVLLMADDSSQAGQVRAAQAGVDAVLAKPVLVKDVLAQVNLLLERRSTMQMKRRERPGNLSGTLGNLNLVDLLQLMETGSRSGIVHISTDPKRSGGFVSQSNTRATLYFKDGDPIDAKMGGLRGLNVIYRVMLWEDGQFEVRFQSLAREDQLHASAQTILLEGMRRLDEWSRFGAQLPRPNTALVVDYDRLSEVELTPAQREALPKFDGRATILEVSEALDNGLERVSELARLGVVRDPAQAVSEPPAHRMSGSLPPELEEAIVPSTAPSREVDAAAALSMADLSGEVDVVSGLPVAELSSDTSMLSGLSLEALSGEAEVPSPPTLELDGPNLPAGTLGSAPASPQTLEVIPGEKRTALTLGPDGTVHGLTEDVLAVGKRHAPAEEEEDTDFSVEEAFFGEAEPVPEARRFSVSGRPISGATLLPEAFGDSDSAPEASATDSERPAPLPLPTPEAPTLDMPGSVAWVAAALVLGIIVFAALSL